MILDTECDLLLHADHLAQISRHENSEMPQLQCFRGLLNHDPYGDCGQQRKEVKEACERPNDTWDAWVPGKTVSRSRAAPPAIRRHFSDFPPRGVELGTRNLSLAGEKATCADADLAAVDYVSRLALAILPGTSISLPSTSTFRESAQCALCSPMCSRPKPFWENILPVTPSVYKFLRVSQSCGAPPD